MYNETVIAKDYYGNYHVLKVKSTDEITLSRVKKHLNDKGGLPYITDVYYASNTISIINIDPPAPKVVRSHYLENVRGNHFKYWKGELFSNGTVS